MLGLGPALGIGQEGVSQLVEIPSRSSPSLRWSLSRTWFRALPTRRTTWKRSATILAAGRHSSIASR